MVNAANDDKVCSRCSEIELNTSFWVQTPQIKFSDADSVATGSKEAQRARPAAGSNQMPLKMFFQAPG
jgi:hypothetical protein